ncbi:MAG TPA: hypothetical protein VMU85_02210 [Stellaceae bacterium]|nr:hypothetical protein [Stellaceae bacterium]
MRLMAIIGLVLVVLGIIALVVQVIPVHHKEQVAKIGPLTASTDKETDYYVPPYAAIIAVLAGGGLVYAGMRRT